MYGEDSYLDSWYEDQFETPYDPFDSDLHIGDEDDLHIGDEDPYDYDRDVDDSFPMYLEYDGPFGLSGYDEY